MDNSKMAIELWVKKKSVVMFCDCWTQI